MDQGELTARRATDGAAVRCAWRDGRIIALEPAATAPDDAWLAPTLFDPQVNGYVGIDFQRTGVTAAEMETGLAGLRRDGCGQILYTLTTSPWDELIANLRRARAARDCSPSLARAIVGWHIEGPFISPVRGFAGAHDPRWMCDATPERLRELRAAAGDLPLMLTLAPERAGGIEAVKLATTLGMVVAIGHSDAPADVLRAAVAAGARAFTHLGNGIPQALDRHDNVVWRVLDGSGLVAGIIPDAIHVSPTLFRIMHRSGVDAYYTTDAMAAAGMPPGRYRIGALEVDVGADQVVREPGKPNFAGSALTPLQGVFRAARMLDRPWQECWARFSTAPRRLMGIADPLVVGAPADFCIVRGRDRAEAVEVVMDGAVIARHAPAPG
ncbi:MAG: N-acetylglucosamine-6-phosphate deacetylase [Planctomycetes bacterium]|nr:N-acetylglucosamine-6-phosphate deacetylase [Planctomycetota bacterium]